MRFTLSSSALSSKLSALSKVINSKNALPILGDFVFDIDGQVLTLTASDGENTMRTALALTDSDGNGRFAIGSHDLLEAVKGISEQPITFDASQEQNLVKISYQNGLFSLPIENADEFPMAQPVSDFATIITLPNLILAENINRSIFATAQDELRPVMNGIYFDLTAEGLAVVASDGHKLVRNKVFTITSEQPAAFILPKKPANLLRNLLGKDGGDVIIRFDERNAEVNYGDGILQCRLIEGRYPNYNSVIPQNNPNELRVDRLGLLAALRRVQPFANDSSNLIRFHVEGSTLQLDAEDYDFSKTATERMTCEYNGQPMSIGFKGSSFIEVLSNFDCQEVIIQLADPSRAGLVLPSEQPENQDVLMLMMPMLIND
jgi:DNA polymerase-3 subunit beta